MSSTAVPAAPTAPPKADPFPETFSIPRIPESDLPVDPDAHLLPLDLNRLAAVAESGHAYLRGRWDLSDAGKRRDWAGSEWATPLLERAKGGEARLDSYDVKLATRLKELATLPAPTTSEAARHRILDALEKATPEARDAALAKARDGSDPVLTEAIAHAHPLEARVSEGMREMVRTGVLRRSGRLAQIQEIEAERSKVRRVREGMRRMRSAVLASADREVLLEKGLIEPRIVEMPVREKLALLDRVGHERYLSRLVAEVNGEE